MLETCRRVAYDGHALKINIDLVSVCNERRLSPETASLKNCGFV